MYIHLLFSLLIAGPIQAQPPTMLERCAAALFGPRVPVTPAEAWNYYFDDDKTPVDFLFPLLRPVDETVRRLVDSYERTALKIHYRASMSRADASVTDRDQYTYWQVELTVEAVQMRKLIWERVPGLTEELAADLEVALARWEHLEVPLSSFTLDKYRKQRVAPSENVRPMGTPRVVPLVPLRGK